VKVSFLLNALNSINDKQKLKFKEHSLLSLLLCVLHVDVGIGVNVHHLNYQLLLLWLILCFRSPLMHMDLRCKAAH
jgi:hypothetical protein